MTEYEFDEIINDVIASLLMEGIIVADTVIEKLKEQYVVSSEKILIKSKGGFNSEYRTK